MANTSTTSDMMFIIAILGSVVVLSHGLNVTQCDFEDPAICGYTQQTSGDDFDWLRQNGGTASSSTGPSNDHTLGTAAGFYMYVEASSPRVQGDLARLWSPTYQAAGGHCIEFFYHMYGSTIGTLSVYIVETGEDIVQLLPSWSESANHGNQWYIARFFAPTTNDYQIVFEGVIGSSWLSDIAIDDVRITDGSCLSQVPTMDPTTEVVTDIIDNQVTEVEGEMEFVDESTTLPMDEDDGTVAMETIDTFTTSSPDEIEREKGYLKTIKVKFTLPRKSPKDIGEPLRQDITNSINPILKEKFKDYNTSQVSFSGYFNAVVELDFSLRITYEERREVLKVLYEMVERNNTIGNLCVEKLYVWNKGRYDRIEDACDITLCPSGMSCFSEGNDCSSTCADNDQHCHHGACQKVDQQSTFITCKCEEGFTGTQCDRKIGYEESNGKPDLYVGIIAASAIACIIVLAIILATCINIFNKRRIRTGRSEELFGIENVVALELIDEKSHLDGTSTQTDESFLLARSHKDGVAPKSGHAHKIMQTNDSFLLAKSQLMRAHGSATRYRGAGSPVGVVSGNTRRLSDRPSSSKMSGAEATPSTSTAGGNGVARKPSTKKDHAPPPPLQSPASTSQDEEAPPTNGIGEPPISSKESVPKPADPQVEHDEGNVEVPPPETPIKSVDGDSVISDAYSGRKILKV